MVEEYEQNANLHLLMHDFTQKKKEKKVQCGKPLAIIGIHKTLMKIHVKSSAATSGPGGLSHTHPQLRYFSHSST